MDGDDDSFTGSVVVPNRYDHYKASIEPFTGTVVLTFNDTSSFLVGVDEFMKEWYDKFITPALCRKAGLVETSVFIRLVETSVFIRLVETSVFIRHDDQLCAVCGWALWQYNIVLNLFPLSKDEATKIKGWGVRGRWSEGDHYGDYYIEHKSPPPTAHCDLCHMTHIELGDRVFCRIGFYLTQPNLDENLAKDIEVFRREAFEMVHHPDYYSGGKKGMKGEVEKWLHECHNLVGNERGEDWLIFADWMEDHGWPESASLIRRHIAHVRGRGNK